LPKKNGDALSSFADMYKTYKKTNYKQSKKLKKTIIELIKNA